MSDETTQAAIQTYRAELVESLSDEADLCRNDGADDIANLLDEARTRIVQLEQTQNELLQALESLMRSALEARTFIVNAPELRYTTSKNMPAESLYFAIRAAQDAIAKARGAK